MVRLYCLAKDRDVKRNGKKNKHFFTSTCEAEEKASLGTLSLHPQFLSKHRNIPSSCPWAAEEPQKMSKHANEAGNKENVNSSPAFHVKNQRTIYLHFQTKNEKSYPDKKI